MKIRAWNLGVMELSGISSRGYSSENSSGNSSENTHMEQGCYGCYNKSVLLLSHPILCPVVREWWALSRNRLYVGEVSRVVVLSQVLSGLHVL